MSIGWHAAGGISSSANAQHSCHETHTCIRQCGRASCLLGVEAAQCLARDCRHPESWALSQASTRNKQLSTSMLTITTFCCRRCWRRRRPLQQCRVQRVAQPEAVRQPESDGQASSEDGLDGVLALRQQHIDSMESAVTVITSAGSWQNA